MTTETEELQLAPPPKAQVAMTARGVQLTSIDEMFRFCQGVVRSRLVPKGFDTPEAVMVAVQRGLEVGLSPMQALDSICLINGRPCIYGDAPLALAMARPDFVDINEGWTGEGDKLMASCTLKRGTRAPLTRTFSVADAKKAGLWGKAGPWTQYPARMLQMRARSWALRDAFPDALKGIRIAEEVRDTPREEAPAKPKMILPGDPAPETPALPAEAEKPAGETAAQDIDWDAESN